MKKKSFISLFAFLLGFGVTTTSCEDMLTPDMDRYAEGFTGRDTVNFYLGILSNVQDVIENNIILGEVRGDMVSTTDFVSDSVAKVANFDKSVLDGDNGLVNRAAYYKVINQCNFYLAKVDTMAMKNNIYYMRKEFAQVQLVRAWTYMQLVQLYGEVPFITEPVDNADTGWEKNPPKGFANVDNLLEKLIDAGLDQAYTYERTLGYPNYGEFNTGAVKIPHSQTLFPGDLVMGDLYLLRGASKQDYEKAAAYYYNYIEENNLLVKSSWSAHFSTSMNGDKEIYQPMGDSWASSVVSLTRDDGAIALVPSAANSSLGKTLTRVQQLYGFDPKSSNHTSIGGENNDESVVSGNMSITVNYKNRQLGPSVGYQALCKSQLVADPEMSANEQVDVKYPDNLGDCRFDGSVKYVQTLGGRLPFVQKFGNRSGNMEHSLTAFHFRYGLPVYRVNQIYLRYAEAINRAGYPRHAFAVLRNGLNNKKMPYLRMDSVLHDDANKITYVNIPYASAVADGNNCIDKYELYEAMVASVDGIRYLDFSEFLNDTRGVHEMGCGSFTDMDSLYTYDLTVLGKGYDKLNKLPEGMKKENLLGRIQQEESRLGLSAAAKRFAMLGGVENAEGEEENGEDTEIDRTGYDTIDVIEVITGLTTDDVPDSLNILAPENLQTQINAVETLIADEMALETAFEGWRYFDLYRIARHKNMDSSLGDNYGTQWFAWLVSRRSLGLKPYEEPTRTGELYNLLLDQQNWYLNNPKY